MGTHEQFIAVLEKNNVVLVGSRIQEEHIADCGSTE